MKERDVKNILAALCVAMKEAMKVLEADEECECPKHEEKDELSEMEMARLKECYEDYKDMFYWAFNFDPDENAYEKIQLVQSWTILHPTLPGLFIPEHIENSVANLLVLMQIVPHWHEHKKSFKDQDE